MGANAKLFLENSEQLITMYEPSFTKKDAILTGKRMVDNVINEGNVDKHMFMANICRLKEVVNSADAEMRKHLPEEKLTCYGVEFTPVNGGEVINYGDDPIYQSLDTWSFVPTMWSALKKSIEDIEVLKTEVDTLKEEIRVLKNN